MIGRTFTYHVTHQNHQKKVSFLLYFISLVHKCLAFKIYTVEKLGGSYNLWNLKAMSIAKKIRLSDFHGQILQTVHRPKRSDFTLSVQVGVHPG